MAEKEVQRKDKKVVEIDLVEMKRQDDIKNTKYYDLHPQTWEDIIEIQKAKGYKIQWAVRYAVNHDIPIPSQYNFMRRIIGV